MSQEDRAQRFRALHERGHPLILYNIWDAGSARAVAKAGAKALATGSASVAAANGYEDGESVPLELVLSNARRIVASTDLPLTLDFERGYGSSIAIVDDAVSQAVQTGIVGCNIEDSLEEGGALRPIAEQAGRLAAARAAAVRAGISLFINARTDMFFQKLASAHDHEMVDQALERARAYKKAGANGLFVPLLVDEELIGRLAKESPLPVNILVVPNAPPAHRLAKLGVARISYGPKPYRDMMTTLEERARNAIEGWVE